MNELNGMTAIVTGAAQGLGKAFAERLTNEGCNVAITDKRPEVDDIDESLGVLSFHGDVSDSGHVHQVVSSTVKAFGTIDILINNAGEVLPTGPLDDWDQA